MEPVQWLVLLGGTLQIGGLALVAYDLATASKRFQEYDQRPKNVYLSAAITGGGEVGVDTLSGGQPPTLEQRVQILEQRVAGLGDQMDDQRRQLPEEMRKVAGEAAEHASLPAKDRDEAMEGLVLGVLKKTLPRRIFSAVLLFLGVLVTMLGGVLGA